MEQPLIQERRLNALDQVEQTVKAAGRRDEIAQADPFGPTGPGGAPLNLAENTTRRRARKQGPLNAPADRCSLAGYRATSSSGPCRQMTPALPGAGPGHVYGARPSPSGIEDQCVEDAHALTRSWVGMVHASASRGISQTGS